MDKNTIKDVKNFAELLKISTESQKIAFELFLQGMEFQRTLDEREKIGA